MRRSIFTAFVAATVLALAAHTLAAPIEDEAAGVVKRDFVYTTVTKTTTTCASPSTTTQTTQACTFTYDPMPYTPGGPNPTTYTLTTTKTQTAATCTKTFPASPPHFKMMSPQIPDGGTYAQILANVYHGHDAIGFPPATTYQSRDLATSFKMDPSTFALIEQATGETATTSSGNSSLITMESPYHCIQVRVAPQENNLCPIDVRTTCHASGLKDTDFFVFKCPDTLMYTANTYSFQQNGKDCTRMQMYAIGDTLQPGGS